MKRILIVEDNARTINFYTKSLGKIFEIVGIASNGKDAIRLAKSTRPDLILMDIDLEGDVDGIQTTKEINAEQDIPIMFVSSSSDQQIIDRAVLTKPFGYMLKPVNFDVLIANINIAIAFYDHLKTSSNMPERKNYSVSQITQNKETSDTIKKNILDTIDESVEIKHEEGTRRIEIVNNRFMKQYWVLED
ncbi:MAG: response regulator [Bacteroidota bacterium]